MSDAPATFVMRLEAGRRFFWSTINPTVSGRFQTLATPAFCSAADFPGPCGEGTRGAWDLWPIKNPARPHPLEDAELLCRPVWITGQTERVALVSYWHKDGRSPENLWLELFLAGDPEDDGSPVAEWARLLRAAMDDAAKEAIVRVTLAEMMPGDLACFKAQKKLWTTDVTLEVQPRAG